MGVGCGKLSINLATSAINSSVWSDCELNLARLLNAELGIPNKFQSNTILSESCKAERLQLLLARPIQAARECIAPAAASQMLAHDLVEPCLPSNLAIWAQEFNPGARFDSNENDQLVDSEIESDDSVR